MKKILTLSSILLVVVALSACTKQTSNTNLNSQTPSTEASTKSMTSTASESATATFAPTSDEDIQAIDKTMDQVNFNDYSDKALDDLK